MAPRETQEDDIPTPPQVKGWRIFTIAFLACMGACMFGYNLGVIGGCITLPNFHADFNLPPTGTEEYNFIVANIVSCFQGGTFFGALLGYPLTERFGRIPTLRLASLVFIVGSAMQAWANGSLGLMYGGRLVAGFGIGGTSLLIPLYLSEISPPSIRGFLVGMHEILNQISSCGGFWVNYGTLPLSGANQWRIPLAIQIVPGGLLLLACFIIPESPRFLIRKGRFEEAGKILCRIRNLPLEHEYLRREFISIKNQAELERIEGIESNANGKGLSRIFGPGDLKRLGIGILMMVAQQCTGVNAMNYYSPAIFKSIGFGGTNVTLFATGIYAIVKSVATLLSLMFFIDRAGRRKLLFIGAGGASLAMWYIGAYIIAAKVDPNHPQQRNAAAWIGIVMVYIYAMFFSIAWNAIPWIYCSEIFPGRIRALCVSITTATQWLGQFVIARATPYMITNIGGGTYMFFGACMIIIIAWVYFFVPETKGRTLESMDELFGVDRTAAVARAQAQVDEMNQRGLAEKQKEAEALEVV